MSQNILVQLLKNTQGSAQLPAGVTFAGTQIVVTDSAGAVQTDTLNGTESPPWSATVTGLANGAGSVTATDLDSTGAAIGSPITQSFSPSVPVTVFPQTTGITVTPA
jgi:hypothetical protein